MDIHHQSAFTDGLLPSLSDHWGALQGLWGPVNCINKDVSGTRLLPTTRYVQLVHSVEICSDIYNSCKVNGCVIITATNIIVENQLSITTPFIGFLQAVIKSP